MFVFVYCVEYNNVYVYESWDEVIDGSVCVVFVGFVFKLLKVFGFCFCKKIKFC